MSARTSCLLLAGAATAALSLAPLDRVGAWPLIVGNDQKVSWDDAGKPVFGAAGTDTVSIYDIGADPDAPKNVVDLPLMNSVFGPPTNLAVTPDQKLAIVANSMKWVQDGTSWKAVPDNKLYVIDLQTSPPAQIATVEVGDQPSGLAINRAGDLALVTNRASKNITVLAINGKDVKPVGSVDMGDPVAAVAFTPDGKRALAVKYASNKASLLEIDGQQVTYKGYDMLVGLFPYNVAITPDGKIGLTADNGASGASDGNIDTVSVIDLAANPPRVIDKIAVGDGPEGFAISPKGDIAVAVLLNGSAGVPKDAWFVHPHGKLAILAIDGSKVTKVDEVDVGRLPEGVAFSPDGAHLYVGNFTDGTLSVLRVDGQKVTDTGKTMKLAGHPASLRGPNP